MLLRACLIIMFAAPASAVLAETEDCPLSVSRTFDPELDLVLKAESALHLQDVSLTYAEFSSFVDFAPKDRNILIRNVCLSGDPPTSGYFIHRDKKVLTSVLIENFYSEELIDLTIDCSIVNFSGLRKIDQLSVCLSNPTFKFQPDGNEGKARSPKFSSRIQKLRVFECTTEISAIDLIWLDDLESVEIIDCASSEITAGSVGNFWIDDAIFWRFTSFLDSGSFEISAKNSAAVSLTMKTDTADNASGRCTRTSKIHVSEVADTVPEISVEIFRGGCNLDITAGDHVRELVVTETFLQSLAVKSSDLQKIDIRRLKGSDAIKIDLSSAKAPLIALSDSAFPEGSTLALSGFEGQDENATSEVYLSTLKFDIEGGFLHSFDDLKASDEIRQGFAATFDQFIQSSDVDARIKRASRCASQNIAAREKLPSFCDPMRRLDVPKN